MVLDYSKGMDLSSWIPTGGLPEDMVSGIMAPICDAMVYLHGLSVVHRDIKPSNVLCERAEDGSVKVVLADFGLAAPIMDEEKMSSRCGTLGFVAPEILGQDWALHLEEEETVTNVTKIDVFSFGITVYATVFGKNPFIDKTPHLTHVRNARCLLPLSNMGGRSYDLQSLLHGLCAKNPCQRYSSSDAFADPWFSLGAKVP
jgi:serine/threonine protein kinase